MKCEECGSPTQMQVQAVISAPGDLAHQFTKKNLRRKDVHLMGVLWETADFICTNPECGAIANGYGNYVTELKKEVERLRAMSGAREVLELIAAPMRPDGTWNRDREACRQLAAEALKRADDGLLKQRG